MDEKDLKNNNLYNINNHLFELLKEQDLDFCKLLIHDHTEDLSITAKYKPHENVVSLSDSDLDADDYYYGVSPELDKSELIRCISGRIFTSEKSLNNYVKEKSKWFMIHYEKKEYLFALAKYIVICMASHFGIRIKMDPQGYVKFRSFLKDHGYSDECIKTILTYSEEETQSKKHEIRPKEPILTVKGCPTEEILDFFKDYSFRYLCGEYAIPLIDTKTNKQSGTVEACEMYEKDSVPESKSIIDIYSEFVKLIEGRVFYSGVLLKPTKLKIIRGTQENNKIQSLSIEFERSTYGTVCAFDRNLTEHPALRDVKSQIIEMLQIDDRAKRSLNDNIKLQSDKEDAAASEYMINKINEYLKECFNVNQIGVSANVVTQDGLLLLGQRSQANIDAKKLYPGVNGNAEIADKNVSFYCLSVYEDYPTIRHDSDRIDFFGEISREAYGELKLDLPKQEWKCCGIVICGKMPGDNTDTSVYQEPFRRMHFNLIFEQHTDKSFLEIEDLSSNAAEAFETERYLGIKVRCEKNRLTHLLKRVFSSIVSIVRQKDFIEAAIALSLVLVAIFGSFSRNSVHTNTFVQVIKGLNWADILSLVLAILIIIVTTLRSIRKLCLFFHKRKKTRHITIYRKTLYMDVNKLVKSALHIKKHKKSPYSYHPATIACLRYYIDSIICDAFFQKDKR